MASARSVVAQAELRHAREEEEATIARQDWQELGKEDVIWSATGDVGLTVLATAGGPEIRGNAVSAIVPGEELGISRAIDVTLCDLAADVRAPTPSAAAEMVSESREGLMGGLEYMASRLVSAGRITTGEARSDLAAIGSRLVHPRYLLEQGKMRLDDLSFRLVSHTRARLLESRSELKHLAGLLSSLGPQAVLNRGYAVVRSGDGKVVKRAAGLGAGGSAGVSYHSLYDNLAWYRHVVGEDYAPARMLARMVNRVLARLANADLLPLDPAFVDLRAEERFKRLVDKP